MIIIRYMRIIFKRMIRLEMKKLFNILFFLVFSVALMAKSGGSAKYFTGHTLDGKEIKLSDFKGKTVLIDFWASWCMPCREEMPALVKFYKKHKNENFVILAVNIDDKRENMKKFINKLYPKPKFPIIWDKAKKIPGEYDIAAMPTTIMLDKNGNERFRHDGFKLEYIKEFEKELELLNNE